MQGSIGNPEFEGGIVEFLNTDKVDPFVIFDADTHEIYMVSASVSRIPRS